MRILLDTHFVIELVDAKLQGFTLQDRFLTLAEFEDVHVSVVSLWEVAIKFRIGKLPLRVDVAQWPKILARADVPILPIEADHVLAEFAPDVQTRDPFDRLLLGVCAAENMKLLTVDRLLAGHPLTLS